MNLLNIYVMIEFLTQKTAHCTQNLRSDETRQLMLEGIWE